MTPPDALSPKSRLVAFLLCLLLGWVGAHRFYVGKRATAVLMILTLGGFGVWIVWDAILIVCGSFRDRAGRPIFRWFEEGSI